MDADTEIRTSAEMSIWQCQDQGGSQMHPRSWGKSWGPRWTARKWKSQTMPQIGSLLTFLEAVGE